MRLCRAEWEVRPIGGHREAVAFISKHHYSHSASNTGVYRHGLYRRDGLELLGVALWLPPTKVAALSVADNWQGVLCLSRLAVHPDVPANGASFLLGRSMRLIDRERWPTLLTYADTLHGHSGGIYKATNWRCVGPVKAGDTWTSPTGEQRGRKRGRRCMTRAEMLAAGYTPNPSAPKIKFVHP